MRLRCPLIDLWDAIWQPALAACELNSKAKSIHDTSEWSGERLDTCTLWNGGEFGRVFDVVNTDLEIYLGVSDDTEQVMLSFAIWGTDGKDLTTGQDFGAGWSEEKMTRDTLIRTMNLPGFRTTDQLISFLFTRQPQMR